MGWEDREYVENEQHRKHCWIKKEGRERGYMQLTKFFFSYRHKKKFFSWTRERACLQGLSTSFGKGNRDGEAGEEA